MKNLSRHLPVFLFLLLFALGCRNPFAGGEPKPLPPPTPPPTLEIEEVPITPTPEKDEPLNKKATSLPKPAYPATARAVKASGRVEVAVEIDEKGGVTSASATTGHPLLRRAAEEAARQARFKPSGAKTKGVIVYDFTP